MTSSIPRLGPQCEWCRCFTALEKADLCSECAKHMAEKAEELREAVEDAYLHQLLGV